MIFRPHLIFCALIALNLTISPVFGQKDKDIGDSVVSPKYDNWYNLDPKKDKIQGISTDRAYEELLKGKPMKRVIVAVIDGGVDIHHKDLQGRIWVNKGEIPGNGIDDDHNGYIDDVNGWNFIGGKDGKNIDQETTELTRLYKKYSERFKDMDSLKLQGKDSIDFKEYRKVRTKYFEKLGEVKDKYLQVLTFDTAYRFSDSLLCKALNKSDYNLRDIKRLNPDSNPQLILIKEFFKNIYKNGFNRKEYDKYYDYLSTRVNYHYNTLFDPRSIVGDNPEVWNDTVYGNNDVVGGNPDHGTFVSGIIAADRNNNLGIKGIADSVKIMAVRTIPDGDERDKDVANAIIYAVNNGAQILNLSFGKDFSPQKKFVDEALKLAKSKDVLIIHAAGNDAENIDTIQFYPNNRDSAANTITDNWIQVGASDQKSNKNLPAIFSNYGKKNVDLFAPGVNICSTWPNSRYDVNDGTSFAGPMVAGAAALLKSVYPSLTAAQLKEILLKSSRKYPKLKVYLPDKEEKKKMKVEFRSLSDTGGVLNVYDALLLAEKYVKK
jgi:subtilisin family serine protease